MQRERRTRLKAAAISIALGLMAAGCGGQAVTDVRYAKDTCRRVALVDAATGEDIRGAEDFAVDRMRRRLIVSAYDRRAVERAVRRRAHVLPEGGVYVLSLDELLTGGPERVRATPVVDAGDVAGGLRPHGLTYDAQTSEIAFINRSYQRIDGRWRMTPRLERVGAEGAVIISRQSEMPCAANDLVQDPRGAYVSFDHAACNWRAGLEDALSLKRSGVSTNGAPVFDSASFANGIARLPDGKLALAATREKSVLILDEKANALAPASRITVPGGPDNLTVSPDGAIVAAVHPSLLLMGVHRRLGFGASPSRIVKVAPDRGAVEVLFDDPAGEVFSAATVAAEWNGALIAGSVTDRGLLICKEKA